MKAASSQTLALRRELLLARVALQRLELREGLHTLGEAASPLGAARRWAAGWREHPTRVLLGFALVITLRRIGFRRVARHALTAWRMWRTMNL